MLCIFIECHSHSMWTFAKLFFYNGIIIIYRISYMRILCCYATQFYMNRLKWSLFRKCTYMHSQEVCYKTIKSERRWLKVFKLKFERVWWSEREKKIFFNGSISNFMNHLLTRSFIEKEKEKCKDFMWKVYQKNFGDFQNNLNANSSHD